MRDSYDRFQALGAEIIAVAPHTIPEVDEYWQRERLPFIGVADPDRRVFRRYEIESSIWSLGQRPGLFVLDRSGKVWLAHRGTQQWHITDTEVVLDVLSSLWS